MADLMFGNYDFETKLLVSWLKRVNLLHSILNAFSPEPIKTAIDEVLTS